MARRRLMAKRRGTPRWARLFSWFVAAVVWVWVFYVNIVPDLPELGSFTNVGSDLLLKVLLFVAVATVLAASAMFLVRLIGQALD